VPDVTPLSDEAYEAALKRVTEYDAQVARGERIVNESTLVVAAELAKLFEDGRWYEELSAEHDAKPKRGRPVQPTRDAFSRWLHDHHARHLNRTRTYQLLGAHETRTNYMHRVDVIPTSEAQTRPLYRLTSTGRGDRVPEVWAIAVEKAAGGQPTREQVAQAVREWWAEHVPAAQHKAETAQRRAERARHKAQMQIDQMVALNAEAELIKLAKYLAEKAKRRRLEAV